MARKKVIPEQDVVFEEEGSFDESAENVEAPAPAKSTTRSRSPRTTKTKTAAAKADAEAKASEESRAAAEADAVRTAADARVAAETARLAAERAAAERLAAERAAAIQADIESRREEKERGTGDSSRGEHSRGEHSRGEGHRGEGHRSEGQRGEGSRGPGHRGEGSRGDSHRGDSHRGDSQRGDSNRAPRQPSGDESFEGGDSDSRRRKRKRRRSKKGGGTAPVRANTPAPAPQAPRGRRGRPNRAPHPNQGVPDESLPSIGVHEGVLELHPKGYGFLRDPKNNFASTKFDPFVAASTIERNKLREGVLIRGEIIPGNKGQGPRLRNIESVEGRTLEENQKIRPFEELTAVNPFERIRLETGPTPVTMRVLDLLTPLGKGQRALIVAPPRTGKTMLLQEIANAVSVNHPEMYLIVLLIDERPEEVTEMRRRVRGEVISSSMDRDVESHVRISQLIIERGKRIAEAGGQVFILLDSITRTARAFNKWIGNTGRTMTGGLDVKAMDIPKKMFGTARRFDEGGSLTVVGTALIDTGSRMDDIIFQEFKGTGNMELVLNRQLADRRIWPSIDITQSGTRREELILTPEEMEGVTMLRRSLVSMNPVEAVDQLVRTLQRFPTNREFLTKIRAIL